ncbi:ALF repeat-containing protein [Kitasatospora purpeofusca]|uniref:ALF repeat-containing protein n=1 Tax=Kitasatospora purpeofusca TaxID=67352 RepID=UPI00325598DC
MKLPKVSAVVAAAVLAPAVLFPSSASAADAPRPTGASGPDTGSAGTPDAAPTDAGQEDLDRAEVRRILADKASGVSVREAAEKALAAGTAAALREFLTTGLQNARHIDYRVDTVRILGVGGPAVKKAAEAALRGSYADIVKFLEEGQYTARAQDDRAEVERILADPATGRLVREGAQKALDAGTPAALRHFLAVDLKGFRHSDYRVKTAQIFGAGGPAVKEAALQALDGSYEEIVAFVEKGQYVARAEDDRAEVERLLADPATGRTVREGAQKALDAGTPAALRHFLAVDLPKWRESDDRVKLSQIMFKGGPAVQAAANAAMDGSYADVVRFLQEGQYTARAQDDRAEIERLLADPATGPGVREAGQKALDTGTPTALRHFLEAELPVQREHDARVALSQIMAKGGPEVRAAASTAMDGSYADVVRFLQEGQYTARAKDNRAQVAQIAETGGPAVKKAALAALDGNEQAVATFLIEGWAKARAEDEAAAKPGTEPTARPTEQPTTAPAAQTGQSAVTGGQVVQAVAGTTSGTGTGTAAVTRTTTGTAGTTGTSTTTTTVGSGQLAATGTEGLGLEAGGAAAALAAGAALVVVSRRRRSTEG